MSKRVRAETIDTFPEEKAEKRTRETESEESWETVCPEDQLEWYLPPILVRAWRAWCGDELER